MELAGRNSRFNKKGTVKNVLDNSLGQFGLNSSFDERKAGCVFAETFQDKEAVELNHGTCFGKPVIDDGAELDGTNDSLSYIPEGEFDSTKLSIVIDFEPDFATSENAYRYIYSTHNVSSNYALILNNSLSNAFRIVIGTAAFIDIPEAIYSPHWKINERNVFVLSAESGDVNAWLNGVSILAGNTTIWSPFTATAFNVGTNFNRTQPFKGTISSLCIYQSKLTEKAAQDLYNYGAFKNAVDELVDGDMEAPDTSAWSPTGNGTLAKVSDGEDGQALRLTSSGVNAPGARQTGTLIAGKTYRVTGIARTGGNLLAQIYTGSVVWYGTESLEWEDFSVTFVAVGTEVRLTANKSGNINEYVEFDDVSVTLANIEP